MRPNPDTPRSDCTACAFDGVKHPHPERAAGAPTTPWARKGAWCEGSLRGAVKSWRAAHEAVDFMMTSYVIFRENGRC